MRRLLMGLMLTAVAGSATAQVVQNPTVTTEAPRDGFMERNNATSADIDLRGVLPLDCGVSLDRGSVTVDLTQANSETIGLTLRCNAPFRLTARSQNGVLSHNEIFDAGNVRTYQPYAVRWPAIFNYSGAAVGNEFSAGGQQWAEGISTVSSLPVSSQRGELVVTWPQPSGLIAGEYVEVFTIEIESTE